MKQLNRVLRYIKENQGNCDVIARGRNDGRWDLISGEGILLKNKNIYEIRGYCEEKKLRMKTMI